MKLEASYSVLNAPLLAQGPKDFLLEKDEANGKVRLSVDVGEYAEVSIYSFLKYLFFKLRRHLSLVALWSTMEAKK